jgi:S-disulfanyl-L-cysteine oxidoreductase SoxD
MRESRVVVLFLFLLVPALAYSQRNRTILDGVYSDPQANRGQNVYKAACASCHGDALEGVSAPELTGNRFTNRWREGMLDGIYGFIKQRMPLGRSPDSNTISDKEYLDLVTFILKSNGYPAGTTELAPDALSDIRFVGKNGPQPVPDGALVITVGCLSQAADGKWLLIRAAEPARSRSELSTGADIQASSTQALGTQVFRLTDLDSVADFKPEDHNEHKMQAKGYIVRQTNADRISLSSMVMLDAVCLP